MLLHPSFFGLLQLSRQLDTPVSAGQIIPPHAFRYFMHKTGLDRLLSEKLKRIGQNPGEQTLDNCSRQFQKIVAETRIPEALSEQFYECYFILKDEQKGRKSFRLQSVVEPLLGKAAYPLEEYRKEDIDGPAALLEAVHQVFIKVFTSWVLEGLTKDPDSAGSLGLFIGMQVQPVFTDEAFGTCYRLLGTSDHIIRLSVAYGNPLIFERGLSGSDVFHVEAQAGNLKLAFCKAEAKTKMWLTPESRLLEPLITGVAPGKQKALCASEDIILQVVQAFLQIENGMQAYRQFHIHPCLLWKVNRETNLPELLDLKQV
ncbi:MAG: PEP/pyruvate-binding domain-containing protein [Niabella sp.]